MKTFKVPADKLDAAKELVNNMVILKGCRSQLKEVVELANNQGVLRSYALDGKDKAFQSSKHKLFDACCYCLPDDIIIEAEPVSRVPEWVAKRYTVCEIEPEGFSWFKIKYPSKNYDSDIFDGLPAALRCDGWVFCGWLHEGCKDINAVPFRYTDNGGDFCIFLSAHRLNCKSSTAYASVWQKM